MEALYPPAAVEPFPPAINSRPGPACECGETSFQSLTNGKYDYYCSLPSSDALQASSSFITDLLLEDVPPDDLLCLPASSLTSRQPNTASTSFNATPGRLDFSPMEVPDLPTVESLQSAHISRPGPTCGRSERDFQNVKSGKCDSVYVNATVDSHLISSQSELQHDNLAVLYYDNVHVYYQNVGGMNTSIQDYLVACADSSYELIVLTETWLDDRTRSQQIFGPNYDVFRCDRSANNSRKTTGGGVLIAVHRKFNASLLVHNNWLPVEQVWVSLKLTDRTLFLCAVYFPPDRVRDPTYLNAHMASVNEVSSRASAIDEVVILGDFNLPGIKWCDRGNGYLFADSGSSLISSITQELLDCYSTATIQQFNSTSNENGRCLDLCFASVRSEAPESMPAPSPLVKVVLHHPALLVTIPNAVSIDTNCTPVPVWYDFSRADYDIINSDLNSIDWEAVLDKDDASAAAMTFSHIVNYIIDRHVPKKTMSTQQRAPWINATLRRLKTKRKAALRMFSKYKTQPLRNHYLSINKRYKTLSRHRFRSYLRNIECRLKRNPKSFWRYVGEQRKDDGFPSTMYLGNATANDVDQICQLFSRKFSSVFVNESLGRADVSTAVNSVPDLGRSLTHLTFDDTVISGAASKLKSSCSAGPDGIPSIFIKKCIDALCYPIGHLFNLSVTSGVFPSVWKAAYMFPIHKKGNKRDVDNYRGISTLCATSKLFELVLYSPIFSFFKQYIDDDQHGFMPKRSTATNLLTLTSYAMNSFDDHSQTDVIYTDLSAAFDKLNHQITVAKLGQLGIGGPMLRWFQSYLSERHLKVKIDNSYSSSFVASSGIPQGSHLGPLIFLIYMNDVNYLLKGPRLSFADDIKLFNKISDLSDALVLQQQVSTFAKWCDVNRMLLNPDKCAVITLSRKQNPITFDYKLANTSLRRENCVKDLGVLLDSMLTFKQHVSYIIDKACRSLGFIMRIAKSFNDVYCLKALYCGLVCSNLEYCITVWSPYYQNGVERIESVQRKFIRFALRRLPWNDPFRLPSYEQRCRLIDLDPLHIRRDVSRAIFVSDMLTTRIDCPRLLEHLNIHAPTRTLRNSMFLRVARRRTNYSTFSSITGLQRNFNRFANSFDFDVSREVMKIRFLTLARRF